MRRTGGGDQSYLDFFVAPNGRKYTESTDE